MKLIRSNFKILEQGYTINDIYKAIELAGRLSYKSEDKITKDSAKKFVDMLIKKGHTSVLEHGTVYLKVEDSLMRGTQTCDDILLKYNRNAYSVYNTVRIEKQYDCIIGGYVTTNYRVLYENNWLNDLKYLCKPTKYHEKRISVKFILPISISREFIRHKILCVA